MGLGECVTVEKSVCLCVCGGVEIYDEHRACLIESKPILISRGKSGQA